MFALILAICSSAMVSIVMRLAQPRVTYPTGLLAANYIVCSLFAFLFSVPELPNIPAVNLSIPLLLGLIGGVLYLSGFVLMQWNTRHNGVVLSSAFMKLGILVPTAMSIVLFGEIPTSLQLVGFLVAILAILVLNYEKNARPGKSSWMLILMLLAGGMCDGMSKIYEEYGIPSCKNLFLFFTFFCAMALCLVLVKRRGERIGIKELLYGACLGIPNFFCSLFLLRSLATVPAVIAFPTFSVAVILVVALAGVLLFKERLNLKQCVGGVLICIALALLNL